MTLNLRSPEKAIILLETPYSPRTLMRTLLQEALLYLLYQDLKRIFVPCGYQQYRDGLRYLKLLYLNFLCLKLYSDNLSYTFFFPFPFALPRCSLLLVRFCNWLFVLTLCFSILKVILTVNFSAYLSLAYAFFYITVIFNFNCKFCFCAV